MFLVDFLQITKQTNKLLLLLYNLPLTLKIALKKTACISISLTSSGTPVYSVPLHTTGQQLPQQVVWHGFDMQRHAT